MNEWEYSNDALEVKGAFYNKEITIYVEGIDDPLFWMAVIKASGKSAYIEDVGGKEELAKYVDKIVYENADFYVAADRDHIDFVNPEDLNREQILLTYGYSIENTLYKSKVINNIIIKYSKIPGLDYSSRIQDIFDDFISKVSDLLILDIANNMFGKGIAILGDSCCRFLKNNNSIEVCENKVAEYVEAKRHFFTESELRIVSKRIKQVGKELWFLIRGHFLTQIVINTVKHFCNKHREKKISLSGDDLYSHIIDSAVEFRQDLDVQYLFEQALKLG